MKYFDCCAYMGAPSTTPDEILRVLDKHGIERAIVCHSDSAAATAAGANAGIIAQTSGQERLIPCLAFTPDPLSPDGLQQEERDWLASLACAARIYPRDCQFSLKEWQIAGMIDHISAEGLPLLIGIDQFKTGHGYNFDLMYEFVKRYPLTDMIITGVGQDAERSMVRLMSLFSNLHIETSTLLWPGAIERFVNAAATRVEQVLFGTQAPACDPAAAIEALAKANISDEEKEFIAQHNFERIVLRPGV